LTGEGRKKIEKNETFFEPLGASLMGQKEMGWLKYQMRRKEAFREALRGRWRDVH